MVGGYQIIDLNQCVLDSGKYYWFPKIAPDFRKPLRLQGIKGKSTNNPAIDAVTDWTAVRTVTDTDGTQVSYSYQDDTADVVIVVNLTDYDIRSGAGCYGEISIIEGELG